MGGFGDMSVPALAAQKKGVMFLCCGLSAICALFNLIGAIAGAEDYSTISNLSWTKGTVSGTDVYFGLTTYGCDLCGNDGKEGTFRYDDQNCKADFCNTCDESGKTAIGLCSIAFILCVVVAVVSFLRVGADTLIFKATGFGCGLVAVIFGIIAVGNWAPCHQDIDQTITAENGPGWALSLVAFLLMILVTILHLVIPSPVCA